jgi:hypothetical protein
MKWTKLFMGYLGSTIGVDVVSVISDTKRGSVGWNAQFWWGGSSNGIAEIAKENQRSLMEC